MCQYQFESKIENMREIQLRLDEKSIANRIRDRRKESGLTQNELALLIGTEQAKISRYENSGRVPNTELIAKLAIALDVSIDWLLGLSEEKDRR